jgi:hypothetical protein
VLAGFAAPAVAGPIYMFSGFDPEAEPPGSFSNRPNSDAAALAWSNAATLLGSITTHTFENQESTTDIDNAVFGGELTISGAMFRVRSTNGGATDGYNTTAGGAKYIRATGNGTFDPLVYTLAFAQPVRAFGFYLTGVGNRFGGSISLRFDSPSSEILPMVNANLLGGAQFMGFTAPLSSISSVSIALTDSPAVGNSARFSFDDVGYVSVPAPSGLGLLLGAALLGSRRRR